jgi:hypothetical protein
MPLSIDTHHNNIVDFFQGIFLLRRMSAGKTTNKVTVLFCFVKQSRREGSVFNGGTRTNGELNEMKLVCSCRRCRCLFRDCTSEFIFACLSSLSRFQTLTKFTLFSLCLVQCVVILAYQILVIFRIPFFDCFQEISSKLGLP